MFRDNSRESPDLSVSSYLQAFFIPKAHCACPFPNAQEVKYFRYMAWETANFMQIACSVPLLSQDELWRRAVSDMKTAVGFGYFWVKNAARTGDERTVQQGVAVPSRAPPEVKRQLVEPMGWP